MMFRLIELLALGLKLFILSCKQEALIHELILKKKEEEINDESLERKRFDPQNVFFIVKLFLSL